MYLSAKYGFAMIVMIGAISTGSPSAQKGLHRPSTGLQAGQTERDWNSHGCSPKIAQSFAPELETTQPGKAVPQKP